MGRGLGIGGTVVLLVLSLIFGRNFFNDLGVEPATGVVAAPLSAAAGSHTLGLTVFTVDVAETR